MKFKDSYRASPVINMNDKPWQFDLFHKNPEDIPENTKLFIEYVNDNNIIIDKQWWDIQHNRCMNGITIPDFITPGGNAYPDEDVAFWNDHPTKNRYLEEYDYMIPPNSCYIPMFDLLFKNKELFLTGWQYFYLNFWPIFRTKDDEARKDILPPKFIDIDYFFFRRMTMMIEQAKDDIEMKSRQLGFSEKLAAMLGFNFSFLRSSVNIIVAGVSDDAEHTMENTQRGLRYLINTQFYKERSKSTSDYWKAKHFGSELRAITAKDNPQALSRFSPYFVVAEEGGKWQKGLLKELKQFVDVSIEANGIKTGWFVATGTGGDMGLGAADLEEMAYNPSSVNALEFKNIFDKDSSGNSITSHFTGSRYFKIIDKDGNSDIEAGLEYVLNKRAKLKPKDKYTHTTQNAIYLSDAFMINTGGYFGEQVAMWCNERLAYIRTHESEQIVERGILSWKNPRNKWEGVYFTPDPEGPFHILEHPMLDNENKPYINLYVAATDSYDQDESFTSTSEGSCSVKKRFLNSNTTYNLYVAYVLERPGTSIGGKDVFYEHTALLTMYYNAKNLIEWSKVLIFEWYTRNGVESLLKERPEFVLSKMIIKSQATNFYGIDPSTKPSWLKLMADYLKVKENIDKCYFPVYLKEWATFKYIPRQTSKYNSDVVISTSLCETYSEDIQSMEVMASSDLDGDNEMPTFVEINGQLVQQW